LIKFLDEPTVKSLVLKFNEAVLGTLNYLRFGLVDFRSKASFGKLIEFHWDYFKTIIYLSYQKPRQNRPQSLNFELAGVVWNVENLKIGLIDSSAKTSFRNAIEFH
jgi:hypothetical protein